MENSKDRQMTVNCKCGKEVSLRAVGGQYQYTYSGLCVCGRKWVLEDLTEDLMDDPAEDCS